MNKEKTGITMFLIYILSFLLLLCISPKEAESDDEEPVIEKTEVVQQNYLPINEDWMTKDEIRDYIKSESLKHGINPDVSLRILFCESGFNRTAKNPLSSATGIAQFIDSTWEHNCKGNRLDPEANVDCFMDQYLKHKGWWVCQ